MIRVYSNAISNKPFTVMLSISALFFIAFFVDTNIIISLKLALSALLSYLITSSVILHVKYFTRVARYDVRTVFDYRFPSYHTGIAANLIAVYDCYAYYYTSFVFFSVVLIITLIILILTAYSRYYTKDHNEKEIIVGIIIGVFIGVAVCMIKIF